MGPGHVVVWDDSGNWLRWDFGDRGQTRGDPSSQGRFSPVAAGHVGVGDPQNVSSPFESGGAEDDRRIGNAWRGLASGIMEFVT